VRHIGSDKALLTLPNQNAVRQIVAVVDRAFAIEHVGDGFNPLVMVRLGDVGLTRLDDRDPIVC